MLRMGKVKMLFDFERGQILRYNNIAIAFKRITDTIKSSKVSFLIIYIIQLLIEVKNVQEGRVLF